MRDLDHVRGWSAMAVAALLVAAATACVDVRDRPLDPTAVNTAAQPSFVSITRPMEGETIFKTSFTQEPGVQITFTGQYHEGNKLLLLVFSDEYPTVPVYASEAAVDVQSAPTSARIKLAPASIEGASEIEILLRVLEGTDRRVISTDSVGVMLR